MLQRRDYWAVGKGNSRWVVLGGYCWWRLMGYCCCWWWWYHPYWILRLWIAFVLLRCVVLRLPVPEWLFPRAAVPQLRREFDYKRGTPCWILGDCGLANNIRYKSWLDSTLFGWRPNNKRSKWGIPNPRAIDDLPCLLTARLIFHLQSTAEFVSVPNCTWNIN